MARNNENEGKERELNDVYDKRMKHRDESERNKAQGEVILGENKKMNNVINQLQDELSTKAKNLIGIKRDMEELMSVHSLLKDKTNSIKTKNKDLEIELDKRDKKNIIL